MALGLAVPGRAGAAARWRAVLVRRARGRRVLAARPRPGARRPVDVGARSRPAWPAAARPRRRARAGDGRAVVLPGQLYAYYDWGGTIDPILPTLADKPVAVRNAVAYARPARHRPAVDGRRARPAAPRAARPARRRCSTCSARARWSPAPTTTAAAPAPCPRRRRRRARRARRAEPRRGAPCGRASAAPGRSGGPRGCPRCARGTGRRRRACVRLEPAAPQTVVDGSADGLAGLAALGGRLNDLAYAGRPVPGRDRAGARGRDHRLQPPAGVRRVPAGAEHGADAGRRRGALGRRRAGSTRSATPADETVAVYVGRRARARRRRPGFPQFPERRPFAALDGDPATHWQADRALDPARWVLDRHARPPARRRPRRPAARTTTARRRSPRWTCRAGASRSIRAGTGCRVHLRGVVGAARADRRLARLPRRRTRRTRRGSASCASPASRASEALRPPVRAERALAGRDARPHRADLPLPAHDRRRPVPARPAARAGRRRTLVRDRGDGESGLERVFSPPAARTWTADGWATVAAGRLGRGARPARRRARRRSPPPGASRAGRASAPRARSTAPRGRGSAPWLAARVAAVDGRGDAAPVAARRRCRACAGRRWSACGGRPPRRRRCRSAPAR